MNVLASERGFRLTSVNDAMDVIASGVDGCVFTLADVSGDFFDLKTGLAGEVFQKFVNYNVKVAFVVPKDHLLGERVTELAREHVSHPIVRIVPSLDEARRWLA